MLIERLLGSRLPFAALPLLLVLILTGSSSAMNLGIPFNPGDRAESAIEPTGDEDPFVFDGTKGGLLSVVVSRGKDSELEPMLKIVDPDGEFVTINLKVSSKKVKLKKLELLKTGRYALVVFGANDTSGAYKLKTKGKPPKKTKDKGMTLAAGETYEIVFGGDVDAELILSIKIKTPDSGLEVLDLLDPDGNPVTGWAQFVTTTQKSIKAAISLTGTFGDFRLILGNTTVATTYDLKLVVKFPKVPKEKLSIPVVEPRIDEITPADGSPGASVVIEGADFSTDLNLPPPEIWFGEDRVEKITLRRADQLRVKVPDSSAPLDLPVDVVVLNPDGNVAVTGDGFTYLVAPPDLTMVTPTRAPSAGGLVMTVTGIGFGFVEKARIGVPRVDDSNVVEVQPVSDTEVTFTSPPYTLPINSPAHVDVDLVLLDRWGQASDPLTVKVVGAPIVDTVDPAGGTSTGGNKVTVHGPNLEQENGDTILLDDQDLNAVFASPGWEFTAPAHSQGIVNLVVKDKWGQQTTVDAAYEFNDGSFLNETPTRIPAEVAGVFSTKGLSIGFADVDGKDGPDLVLCREVVSGAEKLTKLLLNDGSGNFTDMSAQNLPATDSTFNDFLQGSAIAIGHLDGDAYLDIVVASDTLFFRPGEYKYGNIIAVDQPSPSTRVFLGDASGKFTWKVGALPDVKLNNADRWQGNALALGDVDGNGALDIVLGRRSEPAVTKVTNITGYAGTRRIFVSRYPPDEGMTVVHATRVLLNQGNATFKLSSGMPATSGGDIFAADDLLLGDADDDGEDMDIILTVESDLTRDSGNVEWVNKDKTGSASKTRILTNDGNGNFTNDTQYLMPAVPSGLEDWSGFGLALGDIDGDGTDDLVVTTNRDDIGYLDVTQPDNIHRTSKTRIFIGGGSSGFTDATQDKMPSVPADGEGVMLRGHAAAIADVDRDGTNDLVITTIDQVADADGKRVSATRVLLNTGSGVLSDETRRRLPNAIYSLDDFRAHALILGDVDNDVDLDMILTTEKPVSRPTRILIFN